MVKWLTISLVTIFLCGKLGDLVGPALATTHPLQLLILNANDLHCTLTSAGTSLAPWLFVAFMRRIIEDPLFYYAGKHHRSDVMTFLGMIIPAPSLASAERTISRTSYVAVLIDPGALVCTMAGSMNMNPLVFATLNGVGTLSRLLLMRGVSFLFRKELTALCSFVHNHRVEFTCFAAATYLVVVSWKSSLWERGRWRWTWA